MPRSPQSPEPGRPSTPTVVIACDHREAKGHAFHSAGEKYIEAVREGAQALPLLLPVLDPPIDPDEVLDRADGVLLTGAPSNVAPHRYDGPGAREGTLLDPRRDDTTLALIHRVIARAVPLLCICRGFQELNVAFGGSLHQHLQDVPGRFDHRADPALPLDIQYGRAHSVSVVPGSLLADWTGFGAFEVNSLHSQGIDRLGDGLALEAVARDGTIEAVRVDIAPAFAFGVQWHPEWKFQDNVVSQAIFAAFGEAARAHRAAAMAHATAGSTS